MNWLRSPRGKIILGFVAVFIIVAALVTWLSGKTRDGKWHILTWASSQPATPAQPAANSSGQPQSNSTPVPQSTAPVPPVTAAPSPLAEIAPSPNSTPVQSLPGPQAPSVALIVPVAGVRPDQLRDTYSDSRSEGRLHDAIDIVAPAGTPVLASADGPILKLFPSERGGITVYQSSTDGNFIYYYAHLQRYADGLAVGHFARQGETIAYVGDTGNAGTGNYHLHFSISRIADPKRYWEGYNINPYPLLRK
ncbi:MAG: peptidoglycan DD-metalloendopeptidase family protein [Pyrinomonadaceae bacterium]